MRKAVIIIGCSYGDEGKGLAACQSAGKMAGPVLNVLINGGAQRGHTVDLPDGRRHVFHHFGSAALLGAVSCADEDFIVNPLLYMQEREELARDFLLSPALTVSARCRVSTPWDMMLGQIIEENRGRKRHGSCGCGIQETRLRYLNTDWALPWEKVIRLDEMEFLAYCRKIREEYLPARLEALSMRMPPKWKEAVDHPELPGAAWLDLKAMRENTECYGDWKSLAMGFPSLVFEAGQGLALDAENREDYPYLTPSRTTSRISAERIAALEEKTETEILYVTRSYLTRHGAGPLPTECPKERINGSMEDRTNVPNPHQETLRYGVFDGEAVLKRVEADLRETRKILPEAVSAVLVTHLNETDGKLTGDMPLSAFTGRFEKVWLSDTPWGICLSEQ